MAKRDYLKQYLEQFIEETIDNLKNWEQVCLSLENGEGDAKSHYGVLFRIAHNLKGGAQLVQLKELSEFLHTLEDFLKTIRDDSLRASEETLSLLLSCEEFLRQWVEGLRNDSEFSPGRIELEESLRQTISRKSVVVEFGDEEAKYQEFLDQNPEIKERIEAVLEDNDRQRATDTVESALPQVRRESTIRVSAAKLDQLIQLVGELSLHQSIVVQARASKTLESEVCQEAIVASGKLTKSLQASAISLRMQPVQGLFQRLERTARDLSRSLHKPVKLEMSGSEVSLDKTVLDAIAEPLIHVIRNSMDHGIESKDERVATGKPDRAKIKISAVNQASGVLLEIEDDGRGIDPEKVYRKAVDKGLVGEDIEINESDKIQLIFLPGISTAEQVSEVSGRGVGMDVLKSAVDGINGRIEIQSQVGQGTRIGVHLPVNLSIVEALVVRVGGLNYAVPTRDLSEVIDLAEFKVESSGKSQRMINLRGKVVPVNALQSYLPSAPHLQKQTSRKIHPALVFEAEEGKLAFWVDEVRQQQQVFVRPLNDHLAKIPGVVGSTILSNGEPSMIINLPKIAKLIFERTHVA